MREIFPFVGQLLQRYPAIRAIWLIHSPLPWRLMAFADPMTLSRLRKARDLHRDDVSLRVVTDGDRFETPWGILQSRGSLMGLAWRETASAEAYYTEASWAGPAADRDVQRTRTKAVRLWATGEDAPAGLTPIA